MARLLTGLLALSLAAAAADLSSNLLDAAAAGKTNAVKALLDKGANVEARDKKDRTPLMLAAQHGHADTIRLLLANGARADARDQLGYTAYGLTVFAAAGHGDRQEVIKALPPVPPVRLAVSSELSLARALSSCFMSKGELPGEIGRLHLDSALREEFLAFAGISGKNLVEIVREPAEAQASFTIVPSVNCAGEADELSVEVNVRVFRAGDRQLLFEKTFGGGIKGLHTQAVNNFSQYGPVLLSWLRLHTGPIYWAVAEALYRAKL